MERENPCLTIEQAKVGDGCTVCYYTDRHAYTIIKKTAKTITIQRDDAKLLNKPEIITGGFFRTLHKQP